MAHAGKGRASDLDFEGTANAERNRFYACHDDNPLNRVLTK